MVPAAPSSGRTLGGHGRARHRRHGAARKGRQGFPVLVKHERNTQLGAALCHGRSGLDGSGAAGGCAGLPYSGRSPAFVAGGGASSKRKYRGPCGFTSRPTCWGGTAPMFGRRTHYGRRFFSKDDHEIRPAALGATTQQRPPASRSRTGWFYEYHPGDPWRLAGCPAPAAAWLRDHRRRHQGRVATRRNPWMQWCENQHRSE